MYAFGWVPGFIDPNRNAPPIVLLGVRYRPHLQALSAEVVVVAQTPLKSTIELHLYDAKKATGTIVVEWPAFIQGAGEYKNVNFFEPTSRYKNTSLTRSDLPERPADSFFDDLF